jgi:hypothetical protein
MEWKFITSRDSDVSSAFPQKFDAEVPLSALFCGSIRSVDPHIPHSNFHEFLEFIRL